MILKYKLKQNDYFQLNLFNFKEENSLKKIIFKNALTWTIIFLVIVSSFIYNNEWFASILIGIVGIVITIRTSFQVKKHYSKIYLSQTKIYKAKFNLELTLEITDEHIKTATTEIETITKISQIEKIIETKDYYYIKLKPEFIFIPKSEIENRDAVKIELQKLAERLKIDFQNKLDWKW